MRWITRKTMTSLLDQIKVAHMLEPKGTKAKPWAYHAKDRSPWKKKQSTPGTPAPGLQGSLWLASRQQGAGLTQCLPDVFGMRPVL